MTEQKMVDTLVELLNEGSTDGTEEMLNRLQQVTTFDDEMMLTSNKGLVVRLDDGTEFQVTVVQSRGTNDG